MKKILLIQWLLVCCLTAVKAQVNFKDSSQHTINISWDNYSTSYLGEGSDSLPLIVSAIPYNGVYDHQDEHSGNTPMDMSFSGYRFRSQLSRGLQQLYTYDSGEVYFLSPGVFNHNAHLYEFRVLEDTTVIKPWGPITSFMDASFQLNVFRLKFGFMGSFSTTWGHRIVVELRRKNDTNLIAASSVYWQPTRPSLQAVFTTGELTATMLSITNDYRVDETTMRELFSKYAPEKLDSVTGLPKHWMIEPGQNGLIFQVAARVYKKGTVEYRVTSNGRVVADWTGNKANNSYIWLDNPGPGDYVLEMRYRKQRHNVTSYPFTVKPAWYQTWTFWLILVVLKLAFVGFLVLLFKLRKQRRKTAAEQAKKERYEQGLKSVYAQLNPHFTFNALSSIQGLINSGDIRGANHYLSEFGNLLRHSLADSEKASIPLQRELQTLDTYLKLEKLRFNFAYDIHVAASMPVAETEVPSLLLQPLAENAVKHGVATLKENGLIQVEILQVQQDMVIRISDNGPGFVSAKETAGYGLKLTRDRIALLNEMAGKEQIQMKVNSEPGKGAVIELLFKNWLA
jgi:two-component system, LytTR family, sensor kinase